MTLTKTMKAVVASSPSDGYHLATNIPQPILQPGTMLVRVHAVSLNHYDYKIVDFGIPTPGIYVGGCDFAGVVIAAGPGVTRFQPGHRVLSFNTHGGFADYALAVEDLSCLVPDSMPFTLACTLGAAIGTAGLALFDKSGLNLPLPVKNEWPVIANDDVGSGNAATTVLVSGGASASGTMATQLLKLCVLAPFIFVISQSLTNTQFHCSAGFNPIVTCSPASFELCKSFGATACFDYHSTTCAADIRSHTNNTLAHVLDCVTDASTMSLCYEAIGAQGGSYIALEPTANTVKYKRRDIRADWIMANTLLGDACKLPGVYGRASTSRHREFSGILYKQAECWLREDKIRNHPIYICDDGLASIPSGLRDLQAGVVKGKKLVVPLDVGHVE